ncbi:MAG: hypothetical protein ACM30I_12620 [Gemmatimonas sp.]
MSATLACWEPSVGLDPRADDFDERFYAVQRARLPPTPTMLAFVEFLLAKYPDLTESKETIWADGPLKNDISGGFIHFSVTWSGYTEGRLFVRPAARKFGLDFYDPQDNLYIPAETH